MPNPNIREIKKTSLREALHGIKEIKDRAIKNINEIKVAAIRDINEIKKEKKKEA